MEGHMAAFEDLSNELIYEIFGYLGHYQAFEAFYDQNTRFRRLLADQDPADIRIALVPTSSFDRYYEEFLRHRADRVRTLSVRNPFVTKALLSSSDKQLDDSDNKTSTRFRIPTPSLIRGFSRIRTLHLAGLRFDDENNLLEELSFFPELSSLIIDGDSCDSNGTSKRHLSVRRPSLTNRSMTAENFLSRLHRGLPTATNISSSIEHLVLKHTVNLDQLLFLLPCVPRLRHLSVEALASSGGIRLGNLPTTGDQLTFFSAASVQVSFRDFQYFAERFFVRLRQLRIRAAGGMGYADARKWQHLISTHMPCLEIFDLEVTDLPASRTFDRSSCLSLTRSFATPFWKERNGSFTHEHYDGYFKTYINFRCRQPDRRALMSVQHVQIGYQVTSDDHLYYCSNANELLVCSNLRTFNDRFPSEILPWSKLRKIIIDTPSVSFSSLSQLLSQTPQCRTLRLNTITLETDCWRTSTCLPERDPSRAGHIVKVSIASCGLKEFEALTHLLRSIEHLQLGTSEQYQPIIEYVLSNNGSTGRLCSLTITSDHDIWPEKVENVLLAMDPEKRVSVVFDDYRKCRLEWRPMPSFVLT